MDQIGVFSPEQARLLWQDFLTRQQLQPQLTKNFPQRRPVEDVSPHRVFVRNTETETIPPYACMRVIGTELVGGRTVVKVEKPTSTSGEFLFNGPYEIPVPADEVPEVPAEGETPAIPAIPAVPGCGWAYRYGVVVMLGEDTGEDSDSDSESVEEFDGDIEPVSLYMPLVGTWRITPGGGQFRVFGEHDVSSDALIGRYEPHARLQAILSEDLLAAVNTKRDPSTATCRILKRKSNGDLTLTTQEKTVVNRFKHISLNAGTYLKIEWIDGEWQPYAADCPSDDSSSSESV